MLAAIAATLTIAFSTEAHAKKDRLAPYVRAAQWVSGRQGPVYVELAMKDGDAIMRLRSQADSEPDVFYLGYEVDKVLELLADKRMQFLWEPLTSWAGTDLVPMRDRMILRLRQAAVNGYPAYAPATTAQSTVDYRTGSLLQLADYLEAVGHSAEAEELLQERLVTMKLKPASMGAIEWFAVAAEIASARRSRGDTGGAIAQYSAIEQSLGESPFAVNATVSRAAVLASNGQYSEALETIDRAQTKMTAQFAAKSKGDAIPGNDRQFAWIRACALEGLGRHEEAEIALQVLAGNRELKSKYFVEPDDELRFRARVCMRDSKWIVRHIIDKFRNALLADNGLLALQPNYKPTRNADMWATIRSDTELQKVAAERMRTLPPELTDALNGWRTSQ